MKQKLVAFFSASGVTRLAAGKLAEAANADLYEIRPDVPYSESDLNWIDQKTRATVEQNNANTRPALADQNAPIANHDVIYLGFPIWWYIAPRIIQTFLESYDFSGKTVVLFATSGGSGFGKTVDVLKQSASPTTRFIEGKLLNGGPSVADLIQWVTPLKL